MTPRLIRTQKKIKKGHLVDEAGVFFLDGGRVGDELLGRGVGRERLDVKAGSGVGEGADQADPLIPTGCSDERAKPAGRKDQVVIGQDDERGVRGLEADIAGAGKASGLGRFKELIYG